MKNKKINILAVFTKMLYFIFIALLFYIVGVLIQMEGNYDSQENDISKTETIKLENKVVFTENFPGCDLLSGECLNLNCKYYFLCSDQKYLRCEVYDCGEEFGVGTKDKNGKIKTDRRTKEDREKISRIKDKCRGTVKTLESNCLDEKLEMKIEVITDGDCKIEGFWIKQIDKEAKPVKFSSLGNGSYSIIVNGCEEISEIIATGENGISIK
ncbi:MAG: hypothetical protein U9N04_03580 [Patescibacteria group bacterium]|nr:hypothetical protein [Patescibacteria group bacterium]